MPTTDDPSKPRQALLDRCVKALNNDGRPHPMSTEQRVGDKDDAGRARHMLATDVYRLQRIGTIHIRC